jgi:hypothetical protein
MITRMQQRCNSTNSNEKRIEICHEYIDYFEWIDKKITQYINITNKQEKDSKDVSKLPFFIDPEDNYWGNTLNIHIEMPDTLHNMNNYMNQFMVQFSGTKSANQR